MRGSTPASIEILRISFSARPSGRFLWTAIRWRIAAFSSLLNTALAPIRFSKYSSASGSPAYCSMTAVSTALVAFWRSILSTTWVAASRSAPWLARSARAASRRSTEPRRPSFSLPTLAASSRCACAKLLDRVVGDVERVEDLRLGDLVGARLDHQDRLLGTGDDEVEVGVLEQVLLVRVDDEVAVDLADADRADRGRERHLGDHQRGGCTVHREDVVRVLVIDAQRHVDEVRVVVPALGEERADRTVDHAGGQGALLAGAALALEERAGDLARGVHALLDVDGQRQEVDVLELAHRGGGKDHRVALADDDCTGGLLGHLAGLEADLGPSDIHGDRGNGVTTLYFLPLLLARSRFERGLLLILRNLNRRSLAPAAVEQPQPSTTSSAGGSRPRIADQLRRPSTMRSGPGRSAGESPMTT